jgi:hypothetical protein
VQTVSMTWQHSGELAAVLAAGGAGLALAKDSRVRAVGALARETATIAALYGLWQLAGKLSVTGTDRAHARAVWIRGFESDIGLPSERASQQLILGHSWLVQFANLYYATMHFTVMLGFLLWLFVRHREQYRPVRQVMAWTTLGCLLIQLLPVAPPRMFPDIVDTGLKYHQSVYDRGLPVDQLSAMPSVHVGWAIFVGYYAWRVSPSRWRWLGPAHAALMTYVVVATGNHWWLDGIVAALVLVIAAWAVFGVRTAWRALLAPALARVVRPRQPDAPPESGQLEPAATR